VAYYKKKKKIANELKRPDQFVDFWTHTYQKLAAVVAPRRRPLLAMLVAVVVAVTGAAILDTWDHARRVTASESLERIQRIANEDLLPATGDVPTGKDAVPRFKTADERNAAVVKELDGFLGGSKSGRLAADAELLKATTLLDAGRFDDARAAFEKAQNGKLDPAMKFLALEGIGYAHEGKKDYDGALSAFAKLESSEAAASDGFYKDRALYHKARITELKGDKAGAAKLYHQVLDKSPETSLRDEIGDRLALVEAK